MNLCQKTQNYKEKVRFNYLLYNKSRCNGLDNIIFSEIKSMINYNKISMISILCSMNKHKKHHSPIAHKTHIVDFRILNILYIQHTCIYFSKIKNIDSYVNTILRIPNSSGNTWMHKYNF